MNTLNSLSNLIKTDKLDVYYSSIPSIGQLEAGHSLR